MPDPVRVALENYLLAQPTVTSLLGMRNGVFHRRAQQSAKPPVVVFFLNSSVPTWLFGGQLLRESQSWTVKGVSFGRKADRGEELAAAIDLVMNDAPLVIPGYHLQCIYRENGISYPEEIGKEVFQHAGAVYRIDVEPSPA